MPAYRLFPLTASGAPGQPVEVSVFDDAVAIRWAMRQAFPMGADIWEGGRYVGRAHRPRQPGAAKDEAPA